MEMSVPAYAGKRPAVTLAMAGMQVMAGVGRQAAFFAQSSSLSPNFS